MAYRSTLQADALKLVAKKLQSSLAVEGELPEDGLAAYGDDGDDLMIALARKIVSGEADDAENVESAFAQARELEANAQELLVDDGWRIVDPEPAAAHHNKTNGNAIEAHHNGANGTNMNEAAIEAHHNGANGNGASAEKHEGNGHAQDDLRTSIELAPDDDGHAPNGNEADRTATPLNGNGHRSEATEPKQSLFSWTEFMAEQPMPKSRRRKPAPTSLFQWAFTMEQEQEKEPAGLSA